MRRLFLLAVFFFLMSMGNELSAFVSGSTGADGAFNPTVASTTLQIPPSGVFNFTTVNIPSNVTVTFIRNANNTPVYILATGNVTIAGTINVDGAGSVSGNIAKGGPGGFDGGCGGAPYKLGSKGLGPGGGGGGTSTCALGGGGGFAAAGGTYAGTNCGTGGAAYGNDSLIPLIGGSGGGGCSSTSGSVANGGSGGGGAILIASSGTITINGTVSAVGGSGVVGGGGGAIRIVGTSISGAGTLRATGGSGNGAASGGSGRIRIEAETRSFTFTTSPAYTFSFTPSSVFPANSPVLSITSVGGQNVPTNPQGSFTQPDILLPGTTVNPVVVTVSAAYIPVGTTVTVSVIPQYSGATNVATTLSGTLASSTASANVTIPAQTYASLITAQATFVLQTAMYWEGDEIEKVRVAATMGKEPDIVYITKSGKEIKAKELLLAGVLK